MSDVQPVLEMELRTTDTSVSIFERLARDPSVDVDKLERLMQLHERVLARDAEGRFNTAMSLAQTDMRPVAADASNPQTRSRYASYAALDNALRPIYTRNGFGLSFDTADSPLPDHIRVLCYVTHRDGHARTYHVDMPADGKGAKGGDVMTKTHAAGAAMSYGMRYLVRMIWNVAVGEDDRDGNAPGDIPRAPDGYDDWLQALTAKAGEGLDALSKMWRTANEDRDLKVYASHLSKHYPGAWNELKKLAAKTGGAR